jgi:phage terminase small subunit
MAGPKKNVGKKRDRYTHIDPDKSLTLMQKKFVAEYVKTGKPQQSAIAAGYSPKTANQQAYNMIYEVPNTCKAIKTRLNRFFKRLDIDAFDVIQKVAHIAMTDAQEVIPIENGRVRIKNTDELSKPAQALYAGAEERINERGDVTVKVKLNDQAAALQTLIKYFGIIKKGEQETQNTLFQQQIDAIQAVQDGSMTVMDACLELEKTGFAIPDTLRILLNKYVPEEKEDEGDSLQLPTPEEMDQRMADRLAEIDEQKKVFVPKRQEDVRQIKDELSDKDQWKPEQGSDS